MPPGCQFDGYSVSRYHQLHGVFHVPETHPRTPPTRRAPHADVLAGVLRRADPMALPRASQAATATSQGCQCSHTAEGMTSSTHEPADCELAACDRCDSYGDGYSAGKDAAYFAITWELGAHASDCGCRPCLAIRQAVSKVLLAADEPVPASRPAHRGLRWPWLRGVLRVLVPRPLTETDWAALLEPVARELLGDPARRPSSGEWRYRRKGSLAVHVAGPRRGTWRDHKADVGGGVLELLAHVEGLARPEALVWLRHRGLLDGPRTGEGRAVPRAGVAYRVHRSPEKRSTGLSAERRNPDRAEKRDVRLDRAVKTWERSVAVPAAADHPARRWRARASSVEAWPATAAVRPLGGSAWPLGWRNRGGLCSTGHGQTVRRPAHPRRRRWTPSPRQARPRRSAEAVLRPNGRGGVRPGFADCKPAVDRGADTK